LGGAGICREEEVLGFGGIFDHLRLFGGVESQIGMQEVKTHNQLGVARCIQKELLVHPEFYHITNFAPYTILQKKFFRKKSFVRVSYGRTFSLSFLRKNFFHKKFFPCMEELLP